MFAAQVDGKYNSGDYAGALASSEKAKKFAMWGAIAGIVVTVLYVIVIVAAAGAS